MSRTKNLWIAAALVLARPAGAFAVELVSHPATMSSAGDGLIFDFTGDPDLPLIANGAVVTGIKVDWLFAPGQIPAQGLYLLADLKLGSEDSGLGFSVIVPDSSTPVEVSASTTSSTGLSYSSELIDELNGNGSPYGVLEGFLKSRSADLPELRSFFEEGGSLRATLFVSATPVPEPASILSMAVMLGGTAWWLGRRRKTPGN